VIGAADAINLAWLHLIAFMYAPLPSESSAAKLEAGNLMSLHIDVSAMDYSPYAGSVRSDCILFMSDISRRCEDIILLQYDCRTIGRTASRLFVIVSEEASCAIFMVLTVEY
jgi:hypothetical protein